MNPTIGLDDARVYVKNLYTRFPFQYGIASLTALPHLFLRLQTTVNGAPAVGFCAEHLPPKWFTKDPQTRFEEDLPDLIRVVRYALECAREIGRRERVFFDFWEELYDAQARWAKAHELPPLLSNLGVGMVERALIDALCRHLEVPFARLLRDNGLGVDLGRVHPELRDVPFEQFLSPEPLTWVHARHTVGLGDPIMAGDVSEGECLQDGLPQSLERCIERYGYRYFKIKLSGSLDKDGDRLHRLGMLFEKVFGSDFEFTLDGNESYQSVDQFRSHWEAHQANPVIGRMMARLLFVEQPLHRDVALASDVEAALSRWPDRPAWIIDESDGDFEALPRALEIGYAGTSHKNCKGVVKGLSHAARLARQRSRLPAKEWILSGEDLANVGPIALLQDLCVMASLGITHVERNGHHYFRGLSAYSEAVQRQMTEAHGDLYQWREESGCASLAIKEGKLSTKSVIENGFGVVPELDLSRLTPLEDWDPASLEAGC